MAGDARATGLTRVTLLAACVAGLATAWTAPASAAAPRTFGANLSQPVLSFFDGLPVGGCPLNSFFFVKGGQSCIIGNASAVSLFPGVSGIVNTVRVKTGSFAAGAGEMQIVVERAFKVVTSNPGTPNFECCFIQEYGPVFTPRPNAINVIRTQLGMVNQVIPPNAPRGTVGKEDFLALSVFGPNVPLPVGALPPFAAAGFLAYATPAPQRTFVPAPSPNPYVGLTNGEIQGLMVMMNATITPLG